MGKATKLEQTELTLGAKIDLVNDKMQKLDDLITLALMKLNSKFPKIQRPVSILEKFRIMLPKRFPYRLEAEFGKKVFSIFEREKKKRVEFYAHSKESFQVETKVKSGNYIFYNDKWVDQDFNEIEVYPVDIAYLLSKLIDETDKSIDKSQDEIDKLLKSKKIDNITN